MGRISDEELLVFQTAVIQAQRTMAELAKQLKMREYNVRRIFDSLREKGILLGTRPYLNPAALGVTEYLAYLSFTGGSTLRNAFVKELCNNENVSYVGEVGGDYQYEVSFFSRRPSDLSNFIDTLEARFSGKIQLPAILVVQTEVYSGAKHITTRGPKVAPLKTSPNVKAIKIDETDHKILSFISNGSFASNLEIGRQLGIPASTISYRLKNLEKNGLICGHCYVFDSKPFGSLPFILLINSNLIGVSQKEKLLAYCCNHSNIIGVKLTIGQWQANVLTNVQQYDQAMLLVHELQEKFEAFIQSIRIMPQLNFYKYSLYPFKSFSSVMVI